MSITRETRRDAYESVDLSQMEGRVLSVLRQYGPQSAEQIMDRLETRNPNNVRPRLTGLARKGAIRAIGKRRNLGEHNETAWEAV